jgi:hypothetical protein
LLLQFPRSVLCFQLSRDLPAVLNTICSYYGCCMFWKRLCGMYVFCKKLKHADNVLYPVRYIWAVSQSLQNVNTAHFEQLQRKKLLNSKWTCYIALPLVHLETG